MNLAQIELNSEQKFHFVTLCGGVFLPCVVIKMSCSLMLSADSIKGKKRQERNPLVHTSHGLLFQYKKVQSRGTALFASKAKINLF